jgi:hypothetical protein
LRQGKRQEREEDTSVEAEFEKKGFGHGRGCGATGMGGVAAVCEWVFGRSRRRF